MSDSSSRATATASVPGFVRNRGAFEEIYWLYNQLGAHGFAYAMEVDGPTIVADWRSALDAIQRSHPFFSVCIEPNNAGVPFFRHVDGAPIPLRVADGMSGPSWREEMAREIFSAFSGDVAPLLRATLIHEASRAVFYPRGSPYDLGWRVHGCCSVRPVPRPRRWDDRTASGNPADGGESRSSSRSTERASGCSSPGRTAFGLPRPGQQPAEN
jgi:hypothetical protein